MIRVATAADGAGVRIEIEDTGCGMTQAVLQRIYEPFFTTKEAGRGTGLGLAIVHRIIERHRGRITARSQPGRGTVVEIWLPCQPCGGPGPFPPGGP